MLGEPRRWSPREWLHEQHPDVKVVRMELPGSLQGCVDHVRRVIWLDVGLGMVEERCTLAFEIAQLEMGPAPDDPRLAPIARQTAADWAARMLISDTELTAAFDLYATYGEAARFLDVDVPTLRARLRGMTDEEQDAVLEAIQSRMQAAA